MVSSLREGNAFVFAEPLRWGGWYGPLCPPSTGSWSRPRPFSTVSFVNSLELGGEPGLPPRGRAGAASLEQGPWKTAPWVGVVSGVEQRERECRALEGAANVGWALLPALGVGGSRQQAGSARVSWLLGSRFLYPHPPISPVGLGSPGQTEVGSGGLEVRPKPPHGWHGGH